MLRKIARGILVALLVGGFFWFAGTTYRRFAHDIKLQNPLNIFGIHTPTVDVDSPDINLPDVQVDNPTISIDNPDVDIAVENTNISVDVDKPNIEDPTINIEIEYPTITLTELNDLIAKIRVSDVEITDGYNRDLFEKPVRKYDLENKTLTRNKYAWHISKWLIKNDDTGFEYKDPYTGLIITDTTKIDYDHVVPIYYAYQHGAYKWEDTKKNEFSYDMMVGVDVSSTANRSKGAKGPSEWLPSVNQEDYCYTFLTIASEYDISMTQKDINVCKLQIMNAISSKEPVELINQTILDSEEEK